MARLHALRSALRSLTQHSSAALRGAGAAEAAAAACSSSGGSGGVAIVNESSFLRLGACGFAAAAAAAAATVGVGGVHCAPSSDAASATAATGTAIDLSRAGIPAPPGSSPERDVIFVLGGPGSGKGTQCARLVADFPGVVHLSAGDLLRAHTKSGTPDGQAVAEMIANGQIVPSSVTIGLLEAAMADVARKDGGSGGSGGSGGGESSTKKKHRFLVDGFPRNDENRGAYEATTGTDPALVLFFDCPEDVMRTRLLGRGQGRSDDNDETIKKRFRVFIESSLPVVEHYEKKGKVARINADRSPDEVYADVKRVFEARTGAVAAK